MNNWMKNIGLRFEFYYIRTWRMEGSTILISNLDLIYQK